MAILDNMRAHFFTWKGNQLRCSLFFATTVPGNCRRLRYRVRFLKWRRDSLNWR